MSTSVFQCQGSSSFTCWPICEITCAARGYKENTTGGEEEKNCYLKLKSERDFYSFPRYLKNSFS